MRKKLSKADNGYVNAQAMGTDLQHPLFRGDTTVGMITAENPYFPVKTAGGNQALAAELQARGLKYEPTKGSYGAPENSFLVYGTTRQQMFDLGHRYGQESVIYSEGHPRHELLYTNGEHIGRAHPALPDYDIFKDEPPPDYYTTLPNTGHHVRLKFDFDNMHDTPMRPLVTAMPSYSAPMTPVSKSEVMQLLEDLQKSIFGVSGGGAHPHAYSWHDGHHDHHFIVKGTGGVLVRTAPREHLAKAEDPGAISEDYSHLLPSNSGVKLKVYSGPASLGDSSRALHVQAYLHPTVGIKSDAPYLDPSLRQERFPILASINAIVDPATKRGMMFRLHFPNGMDRPLGGSFTLPQQYLFAERAARKDARYQTALHTALHEHLARHHGVNDTSSFAPGNWNTAGSFFSSLGLVKAEGDPHPHMDTPGLPHNDQAAGVGVATYAKYAAPYGTLDKGKKTDLFHYPLQGKLPDVQGLVKQHGFQTYYAGGKYGRPDPVNRNYTTGHLMVYDPTPSSGGDFGDRDYTDAWRQVHELAHGLTHPELNSIYGEGRRIGKLGIHRTTNEALRAVHWEWLAAHKQRELSSQIGVHISDEAFHRELNTVMHDAVHRAVTGKFTEPSDEGFVPHSHKVPLETALGLVRDAAHNLGLVGAHDLLRKNDNEVMYSIDDVRGIVLRYIASALRKHGY